MSNEIETTLDPIVVPQDHGADSVIEVIATIQHEAFGPIHRLYFHSSQSLKSQSARAWNVNEAIRAYCYQRGYQIDHENQKTVTAHYSARAHSAYAYSRVRDAILADPRYIERRQQAVEQYTTIAQRFAPAIGQLQNLIQALEKKADQERKRIDEETSRIRVAILTEMELPAYLRPEDIRSLEVNLESPGHTALSSGRRDGSLPTDLQPILDLLADRN